MSQFYKAVSPVEVEPYYSQHVHMMTECGLHSKSAIACQLAVRDQRIAALESELQEAREASAELQHEKDMLITSRRICADRVSQLEHELKKHVRFDIGVDWGSERGEVIDPRTGKAERSKP